MAEILLEKLDKRFGDSHAVRSIDLSIREGQVTVLVGPSGCGKTTTLRLIAGLEQATSGTISIGGRDVTRLEPKERDVAMVFQNYALYPHMSVRDNIAFGLRAKKLSHDEIDRRVEKAAAMLGIEPLLTRKPRALSGGQQQRVAIGRAIVREPAAFLFDEPLSNLDAKLRVELRTEILKLQRELGATVVHVTHDQEEAMTLAHQVVVMNGGEVVQRGTPAEVYRSPATEFVGRFIGSPEMNVVAVGAARDALGLEGAAVPQAPDLRMGVRPEGVQPAAALPAGQAAARFTARVEVVELLGAHAILILRPRADVQLKALVDARALSGLGEGAEVDFALAADELHFFAGETGQRVPVARERRLAEADV
jgi:multiple sugar transport system ATP-binding protein